MFVLLDWQGLDSDSSPYLFEAAVQSIVAFSMSISVPLWPLALFEPTLKENIEDKAKKWR